jgi:hypothetical protein
MTILVSNLGTQNRDFTVLIWGTKLFRVPSPGEMVRFHSKISKAG